MHEPREHVAFGGAYLIDGSVFTSHLYDIGDGSYGWECVCVDPEGNKTISRVREFHDDINVALLWVLSRTLDYAISLGVEPEDLQILQRSYCPDADPEFIAVVLRTYSESKMAVHH